ncbi:hypothetical protein KCG44_04265 [Pacificimonas sp. WHA3]|uniref:Lipoprotein n=1 Tax=Pacificimonas pallii TaxID=2827236 RepID=A0ABS6SCE7_9SPHN|nr:hypothetical protein [Pacificimonas pallii]MBV7255996.1 hypothetical protein [Pacificimonas pallii]
MRTRIAAAVLLAMTPLAACHAEPTEEEARMGDVARDWQAVTAAPTADAEIAAMERFWAAHLSVPAMSMQMSMTDAATGAAVAVGDFDASAPERYEVTVVMDGETLRFHPKAAGSIYILMRE